MKVLVRLGLILASSVILSALPALVQAEDYSYTTNDDNTINITGYNGPGGALSITNMLNDLPVTSLGEGAFYDCASLTSVTIGDGVTNIGASAFYFCIGLTNVAIPANVTAIGEGAFASCPSLTAIMVNESNAVFSSLDGVLFNQNQTTLIRCPEGRAGSYAIPNGATGILAFAFSDCAILTNLTIPASATGIGDGEFSSCRGLTAIMVNESNSVFSSLDGVLFNKSRTTLIRYPAGKTGRYIIPGGVASIGQESFVICTNLTGITIPASVSSIGQQAFYSCSSLTNIAIPNNVNSIGDRAFVWCIGLTSLTFGNSLTSIGNGAFMWCVSLTSVELPNSLVNLGSGAFENCLSLVSLTFGDGVTNIGSQAFYYCPNLTEAYFEGNAPGLGAPDVFAYTPDVIVYYLPGTTNWVSSFAGRPTMLWNPHMQNDATFGVQANQFGFTIAGTSNLTVVAESCTNLLNPVWFPVGTNTLAGGSSYFGDPLWTNYPVRFYRIHSPFAP